MLNQFRGRMASFISRHIEESRERAVYTAEPAGPEGMRAWFVEPNMTEEPPFKVTTSHYASLFDEARYANADGAGDDEGFGVRIVETITLRAFGVKIHESRVLVWERNVR